jgi:hypothetical protein
MNDQSVRTDWRNAEPLAIRLTAGDAEMVVSWAEAALQQLCPDNAVLRESAKRFREAFNAAARERLHGPRSTVPDDAAGAEY